MLNIVDISNKHNKTTYFRAKYPK